MKKTFLFLTAAFLLFGNTYAQEPDIVWDGKTKKAWTEGTGTAPDPYILSSPNHLAYLAQQVNAGNSYEGEFFMQTAPFDMDYAGWTSIGTAEHPFKGTYDGGSKHIQNLDNAPLFGFIYNATIQNLIMHLDYETNVDATTSVSMVQNADGNCLFSNCYNMARILTRDYLCGGFVCEAHGSLTMNWCYNVMGITAGNNPDKFESYTIVGGLVGKSYGKLTLNHCFNEGECYCDIDFSAPAQSVPMCGGLVGRVYAGSVSINQCSSTGYVTAYIDDMGGEIGVGHLVGYVMDTVRCTIQSSYAKGMSANYLVGYCSDKTVLKGCYLYEESAFESNVFLPKATTISCYYVNPIKDVWTQYNFQWSAESTYCFHYCDLDIKRGTYVSKTEIQSENFLQRINIDDEYFVMDYGHINNGYPILKWQEGLRYAITATCDANRGTVKGGGYYAEGNTVTLTATPKTGCTFVGWSDGNSDNPRTVTVSADSTFIAQFTKSQYTIYVNQDCTGSIE